MASMSVVVATTLVTLLVWQPANGGRFWGCSSRRRELTMGSLNCDYLSRDSEITWLLNPTSGNPVTLGTCNNTFCTKSHPSVTSLTRSYSYSAIYFNATRDMAGTLICSEVFNNGTTVSDNCTQDVVYLVKDLDISVTANFENWTLTAELNTSKVFSVLGVYDANIMEYFAGVNGGNYLARPLFVVREKFFQPFTDVTTGMDYNRGRFRVNWLIPNRDGKYYYTASLIPAEQTEIRFHHRSYGFMAVSKPSPPETNCDFTYVPEVEPISCQCRATSLGTPAGRLQWLVGNDVIVSGGYDVKQLDFPVNRVNRTHDGKLMACQLDWVDKQRVFVTDNVAYGPENVSIQVQSDSCLIIATCLVGQVNPFTPDMMQWGGLCQGHQGAVCTIKSRGAENDGKEVTCTVTNHVNNGHSVTANAKVTMSDPVKGLDISVTANAKVTMSDGVTASDNTAKAVGISVGVTVGIMVFVVFLVLVIMWARRRYCTAEIEEKSVEKEKAAEHTYSNVFEITGRDITHCHTEHTTACPGSGSNEYQNM